MMLRLAKATFCLFALLVGWIGCAQKTSPEGTIVVSAISPDATRLIQLRLGAGLKIHPYEQLDLGTPSKSTGSPVTPLFFPYWMPAGSLSRPSSDIERLVELLLTVRKATQKYFEIYPQDQPLFRKIESEILENICFDDGKTVFCGPSLLTGSMFLFGPPALELALHEEWLPAIENFRLLTAQGSQSSVALENFVRNFDFGTFQTWANSISFLTSQNCQTAHKLLSNLSNLSNLGNPNSSIHLNNGDLAEDTRRFPEKWEINPCNLLLSSHKSKQNSISTRGIPSQ